MRIGVDITDEMVRRAELEADKREPHIKHHFSVEHMSDEQRNIVGFLGEFACCELLGIDWRNNIRNDYLTIDNGDIRLGDWLIDVKTETIPQPYFDQVIKRSVEDDKKYGRRLINGEQVPLLGKYDKVVFGGFVRERYHKWYAFGYVNVCDILPRYSIMKKRPFGGEYPKAGLPIRTSELRRMDDIAAYAERLRNGKG